MQFCVVCVFAVVSAVCAEILANFPRCHNADAECLKNAANNIIPNFFSGLREVNLLPYDPLRLKLLAVDRNPSSPVNVDLSFKDTDLIGLKNMKVTSFTGLNADLSGRTVFEADVAEVRLKGIYTLEGHVLLLPIVGEGPCDIKMKNIHLKFSSDLKRTDKNGQIYASLEHVKLDLDVDHVHFQLDNLFNGNKALGDNMNKVLNESSKEVFEELKPGLAKSLGLIGKQLINKFFEKHPYADYFL